MNFDFSLYKNHEFMGLWYNPENPDKKVVGILRYTPNEGLTLDLEDSFTRQLNSVIHGEASGTHITLVDCYAVTWNGSSFNFGLKYSPSKVIVRQAFIGVHFSEFAGLKIEYCYFKTDDIKSWSGISGFDFDPRFDSPNQGKIDLSYQLQDEQFLFNENNSEISLCTNLSISTDFPHTERRSIAETHYFKMVGMESFSVCLSHIEALSKFLSFSTRCHINLEHVNFQLNDGTQVTYLNKREQISLGFGASRVNLHSMLINFQRYRKKISQLYSAWYQFNSSTTDFIELYFYNGSHFINDLFLRAAQSLEEVHRYQDEENNKMGFEKRVKSLFQEFEYVMQYVGDKDKFCELVRDHRDYFSHWFEKKRHLVLPPNELEVLAKDVNLLLELTFLKALGLEKSEIRDCIKYCHDYQSHLSFGNNFDRPIKW